MQQPPFHRLPFRTVRGASLLLCALTGGLLHAQPAAPPEGIELGRWILAPSFVSSVQYDDNIFRTPQLQSASEVDSDTITNWIGRIRATLPFRNSRLDLDYETTWRHYRTLQFDRNREQVGDARLEMNFGSRDRLIASDRYTEGFSDVLSVDPGGELVFEGRSFWLNRAEIEASRDVIDHAGYTARLARVDFRFERTDEPVGWFNYSGYDGSAEFRNPVSRSKWFLVHLDSRRFNHFEVSDDLNEDGVVDNGTPFRREKSDALLVGIAGFTRPGQPFFVRVGYGEFRYELVEAEPYEGLVASALARLEVGSRTRIEAELSRRPLPSSFLTYYIINEIKVGMERDVARRAVVGLDLLVGRNRYGSVIDFAGCSDFIRKDRRRDLEATLDWELHPRASLAISASHIERGSNCDRSQYDANVGFVGLRFGWF